MTPLAAWRISLILAVALACSANAAPEEEGTDAPENLLSIWSGARVISFSSQFAADQWSAARVIDGTREMGWASVKGQTTGQSFVIELPMPTRFSEFEIDTAKANRSKGAARDVRIEASASSASDGFQTLATVALENRVDGQRVEATKTLDARWVRITVETNHGDPEYSYLMEVRGFGERQALPDLGDLTGSYQSTYDVMHIRREGAAISGCYDKGRSVFSGGIDGRDVQASWAHQNSQRKGPAIFAFNADGSAFYGMWWEGEGAQTSHAKGKLWAGTKVSDTPGDCPNWAVTAGDQITQELEAGRSRIYGILFDTDSAQIRADSEVTLRSIAESLSANADWAITIEGHTDAQGAAAHNRDLSQRRAEAVKGWLVTAGIAADRLSTQGFGADQPVAANDTPSGRAQNRRVELVRP